MATTSKSKWAIYLSAGAFAVVAGVATYNILLPSTKQHTFGDTPAEVLNRDGYLEIRPATNLGGPGAIVTVDSRTDTFVMMHPTCNMDLTELSSLWQSSQGADTNIVRDLSGEFKLGVDILKRAGLDVRGDVINEIDMTFEHVKFLVITDESRFGLERKYLKGDCESAVYRVSSVEKKCVIQPISAVQADITYHLRFSDNITASDKAKILREASGALTTDGQADTSDSITGKGLFVGLKIDTWCIVLDKDGLPGQSVARLPITPVSFVIRLSK